MSWYIYLSVCLVFSIIGSCEKFVWNFNTNENSPTSSQINSRKWENPINWLVSNSIATRSPCQKDNVYFQLNNTYPAITISSQVIVLGMNWKGKNVSAVKDIDNWEKYFVFKDGGSLSVDPDCGRIPVCACRTQNSSRVIELIITIIIIAVVIIATGLIVVASALLLFVLIRKLISAKRREGGHVFTFQTLNEMDIEDEQDQFDVTVISSDEFPSGKAKIPEDLTGLLDEDSVSGDVFEPGEKTQKYKNIPEDKRALLADSNQDITTAEELSGLGNQTDL